MSKPQSAKKKDVQERKFACEIQILSAFLRYSLVNISGAERQLPIQLTSD